MTENSKEFDENTRPDHLCLSEIISELELHDADKVLPLGFRTPHSYRGSYYDLAFEPAENITVGEMLAAAREANGKTYEGWKGGDFTMGDWTPCWLAWQGDCGESIGRIFFDMLLKAGCRDE